MSAFTAFYLVMGVAYMVIDDFGDEWAEFVAKERAAGNDMPGPAAKLLVCLITLLVWPALILSSLKESNDKIQTLERDAETPQDGLGDK